MNSIPTRFVLAAALAAVTGGASAQIAPLEPDSWSPLVRWRAPDGWYSVGVHAALLPDGRVLFIGYDRPEYAPGAGAERRKSAFTLTPTPLGQPVPVEVTVASLIEPMAAALDANGLFVPPYLVDDDLFCTGSTTTGDGLVFTAGGTRGIYDVTSGEVLVTGLSYGTVTDGTSWARVQGDMAISGVLDWPARWYPTPIRLPWGPILVVGGYEVLLPYPSLPNQSVELFDPATGAWHEVSAYGAPPDAILASNYTHVGLLPSSLFGYDVMMFGDAGSPVLMSLSAPAAWNALALPRPGTQHGEAPSLGASTAPLPLRAADGEWGYRNGSMLVAGGQEGTSHAQSADVFDVGSLAWLPRIDLGVPRHDPSTVLLPDGRVLIVAGHDELLDPGVKRNAYVDPAHGFQASLGQAATDEIRGYHHVALLLPDGRVLIGGGRDAVSGTTEEKADFRYYSPPYVSQPRPRITSAPQALHYGQTFLVSTEGRRPAEIALLALGCMTHSFDTSQRNVQVPVTSVATALGGGEHVLLAKVPSDPRTLPPGWYMMFVLDQKRVPSVARMVKVS